MSKDETINNQSRKSQTIIPVELIERKIYLIRGHKVMLDSDLAELYGVATKVLLQSVKRNISRFPEDFMFQLTKEEFDVLRSQIVTSSSWGGRRYLPYVFTEQGVAMLSSVLRSERAIQVNIAVNERNIQNALETTQGTGIGVMNEKGRIVKRAGRRIRNR